MFKIVSLYFVSGVMLYIFSFELFAQTPVEKNKCVITGKVTLADGRPVVGEIIAILPVESKAAFLAGFKASNSFVGSGDSSPLTDDRGQYRAWNLLPGRYKVAVGRTEGSVVIGDRKTYYQQTFSPATTNPDEAKIITLAEGEEAQADIILASEIDTYSVRGTAFDEATKRPAAGVIIAYSFAENSKRGFAAGPKTDINGNFELYGVRPGTYQLFAPNGNNEFATTQNVNFVVKDSDLEDVNIFVSKTFVISGQAIIRGAPPASSAELFTKMTISLSQRLAGEPMRLVQMIHINPDGTFLLRVGSGDYLISSLNTNKSLPALVGVTIDGVEKSGIFNVNSSNPPREMKLIFSDGVGNIQGKVEAPTARTGTIAIVIIGGAEGLKTARPNQDGMFSFEAIKAGSYQLVATMVDGGKRVAVGDVTVIVQPGITNRVNIVLKKLE